MKKERCGDHESGRDDEEENKEGGHVGGDAQGSRTIGDLRRHQERGVRMRLGNDR